MVQFSSRMSQLKGSAIRELLALANKPEVLSFAGGMPAPELFPVDKIKAATDAVLEEQGKIALQYSSTNGFEHFRQQIADRMEENLEKIAVAETCVAQCWRMASGADFVLVLQVRDMPHYLELAARLFTQDANVRNVRAFFATQRAKFETKLPVTLS